MSEAKGAILSTILMLGLQISTYAIFLRPKILSWGASDEEMKMPLIGDDLAPRISATRAISINMPVTNVWKWVIQLGADRGGFFTYSLIEKLMGYKMRKLKPIPEFQDMEVGRIIPASLNESKGLVKFNFPVIAVESEKSFVLQNWGAFVLVEINSTQTRLIVRTHGRKPANLLDKINDWVGELLHYIMERRMLLGLKSQAETGEPFSSQVDNLWLLGLILSAGEIALMIFIGETLLGGLLSAAFGVVWLWVLLILDPQPKFSVTLFLIIAIVIVWRAMSA